jgi:hypothetical protein
MGATDGTGHEKIEEQSRRSGDSDSVVGINKAGCDAGSAHHPVRGRWWIGSEMQGESRVGVEHGLQCAGGDEREPRLSAICQS